jgi:O-antigen/teichoic acid export membrane protein
VLIGALYPTLSRLHLEDRPAFVSTLRGALRGTLLLSVPIGLGCALFADLGPLLFGPKYAGTEGNLVVMAPYVFLVYFSMPLGTAIMAAQKHRAWGLVQFICVAVSSVLDPLLIPWFQQQHGNGGLAVCVAAVVSEICVVGCGMWLCEKGTFDRGFFASLLRCLVAGGAMAAVALGLRQLSLSLFLAAPAALAAYGGALWAVGGLRGEQLNMVRDTIRRKIRR